MVSSSYNKVGVNFRSYKSLSSQNYIIYYR